MEKSHLQVVKDLPKKKITVHRYFDAPVQTVWQAWTESQLLDQWWAPKPWRTETKRMDFSKGGSWLYAMVGPDHDRQWCRFDFEKIDTYKSYSGSEYFCDENGKKNSEFPTMEWTSHFQAKGQGTMVTVDILFDNEADVQKILDLGFEEGFASALGNLEQYLATSFQLG